MEYFIAIKDAVIFTEKMSTIYNTYNKSVYIYVYKP